MAKKKIIKIDDDKCNGCGLCLPDCHEGAIKIVEGKARVDDSRCDGLGACLKSCPQGAISIIEQDMPPARPCGCPGAAVREFHNKGSQLRQWPVQLRLVPAQAPYLNGSDLLVCADCVAFACADLYARLLKGRTVLVACPKLDDPQAYTEKIGQIIAHNDFKSITYARMEVPCCAGLANVIKQSLIDNGKIHIPFKEEVITIQGG